jgi:hypothetical protein
MEFNKIIRLIKKVKIPKLFKILLILGIHSFKNK